MWMFGVRRCSTAPTALLKLGGSQPSVWKVSTKKKKRGPEIPDPVSIHILTHISTYRFGNRFSAHQRYRAVRATTPAAVLAGFSGRRNC